MSADFNYERFAVWLNAFVSVTHEENCVAGWWTGADLTPDGEPLPYVVATKLALIHSEISEALEGYRRDRADDHLPERSSIEVELADAVIRIADLAGALDLDLGGAILAKRVYNSLRADHKPSERAKTGGKKF